jgi:2-oxoglutarate ferredoxin oxidoreductase subunit delta
MPYCYQIEVDRCKGCGLCVMVCPKKVLEISQQINSLGYFPAYQARPSDCIVCAICCTMCPDVAISITKTLETEQCAGGHRVGSKTK